MTTSRWTRAMVGPAMHTNRSLAETALSAFSSALLVLVIIPSCLCMARAAGMTITNGTQFRDTDGKVIQAHGGGMLKSGSYYYWYGEHRDSDNLFLGVSCYRSTNLTSWEYRGDVLKDTSAPELKSCVIERPKVLHNDSTGQYVMWMHWEDGADYRQARAAVAHATSPDGTYIYLGSFRPCQDQGVSDHGLPGYMSRDCSLFQDTDGTGYFISASNDNRDLHLYKLTSDYKRISTLIAKLFPGAEREAPCLFKRNKYYFLVSSQCTGWSPNQAKYAYSAKLVSDWSPLYDLADYNTHHSQPACVVPVQGSSTTNFLYSGDRSAGAWGAPAKDSQYVWLPLRFPSAWGLALYHGDICTIDAAQGNIAISDYFAIINVQTRKAIDVSSYSMVDGGKVIQWSYNGGINEHWRFVRANGYTKLINRNSGKVLEASGEASAADSVVQRSDNGQAEQQWTLTPVGSNEVRIANRKSGKVLDVGGGSTENGSEIRQSAYSGSASQRWRFLRVN